MERTHGSLEIDPARLARKLESGDEIQVLDVRAPERLAAGTVGPVAPECFLNIRGSELLRLPDPASAGLSPGREVVVVCGQGSDSLRIAAWLAAAGFDARSLRGGMTAWMRLALPRPIPPPAGFDRVVQFDRVGKGALGYLLVSEAEAVAVDVGRDVGPWIEAASDADARITAVVDTHVHADYISGGPALARELGVPWFLHPADMVDPYDGRPGRLSFQPLTEGTELRVGGGRVRAFHTPGHTEGSVSVLAGEPDADAVILTGDFLFVASLGRPDLAGRTAGWSEDLWRSAERARTEWGAGWQVLPAHYASEEERRPDRSVARSLGELRDTNRPLRLAADRDAFLSWVRERETSFPDAYRWIKAINAGLLSASPEEADALEAGRNECALG